MSKSDQPIAASVSGDDRREHDRYAVTWSVDCVADDTFLYAYITNISELGIFVKTVEPLSIGTSMDLSFSPPGYEPFKLRGVVAWINPVRLGAGKSQPGMGIRFVDLSLAERERLVEVVRTVAYVQAPLTA